MNYIRMHRRTIGIAACVLAIAAIAGPVASARPNLEPVPTVHVSATTPGTGLPLRRVGGPTRLW